MIKKLFYTLVFMLFVANASAINIGMLGDFNGWGGSDPANPTDVIMTDSGDGVNYTLTNYTFLSNTFVKFRQDFAWATNWGGSTFPTGGPGGDNIPALAGSWDIALNITTGVYSFTPHINSYDSVGIYGGFNSWGAPVPLATANGTAYTLTDYHFTANDVKFKVTPFGSSTATDWSSADFPAGVATANGATIPLTAGYYNVSFDNANKEYALFESSLSLIGDATEFANFNDDVYMSSTDGGTTFKIEGVMLTGGGGIQFRVNSNWSTSWGGTTADSGTATLGSQSHIPVTTTGTYTVTFNRETGAYTLTLTSSAFASTNIGTTAMNTTDGVTYTIKNWYNATASSINFTDPNDATKIWGATAFPAGTATSGSASMIPVPAGYFNVTFNRTSGDYSIADSPVSLIGSFNGWGADYPMDTTDHGLTYTTSSMVLVDAANPTDNGLKFRANGEWTLAWGGGTFLTGTGNTEADAPNIPYVAGTYNVTFERTTGNYTFQDVLAVGQFNSNSFSIAPNPANDSFKVNKEVTSVQIYSTTGQFVKSFNNNEGTYSVSDLAKGVYLVKVANAATTQTVKLIKQ